MQRLALGRFPESGFFRLSRQWHRFPRNNRWFNWPRFSQNPETFPEDSHVLLAWGDQVIPAGNITIIYDQFRKRDINMAGYRSIKDQLKLIARTPSLMFSVLLFYPFSYFAQIRSVLPSPQGKPLHHKRTTARNVRRSSL